MGIQFKNVSYLYQTSDKTGALHNINLNIKAQGEFVVILGQTGSGKSTLVQHMNALLQPTSGTVQIFDAILPAKKRQKINYLRQKVGLVFQFPEYQLFEEKIIDDIAFGAKNFKSIAKEAMARAVNAAKLVGIDETLFNQSPFRISGGQMRRVAIAGILAMEPEILVLDEPTRGLDPQGKDDIMEVFVKLHESENKSIVLITHDMDIVAKYAKRVIVLNQGKLVFDGTKEELFDHPNFKEFHLDYPTPLKILKYLNQKLNLPYKPIYNMEELVEYLREINYE